MVVGFEGLSLCRPCPAQARAHTDPLSGGSKSPRSEDPQSPYFWDPFRLLRFVAS